MSLQAERDADGSGETAAADAGPAVQVDGLVKTFGSGEAAVTAVDDVSFAVESGTAVGLLGPNGAGKTTTIKTLLGLIIPTAGTARVAGVDVHEEPRTAYRHAGAMLEGARNTYWRLSVRENLRFFAALAGRNPASLRDRHDELLERFDLADKADTAVRELSRGMQQKVSLAATLARDAEVVFLDEPTLGLDVESSRELRRELRGLVDDSGLTVLLSSHDMDTIEAVCDRVVIMNEGGIVADDSVEALLDLFRTQTYAVTVEGALGDPARERLRERFGATDFAREGDRERFGVQVVGDDFYGLAELLQEAGVTVVGIDTTEPDLEDVFLQVTESDDGAVDRE